ncbi:MAG TPA: hypothetical protein VHU83_11240 [Bryobacteraceae bacterium]|jgi:hypothetical protein|nr:hypothetical protein [Bryobacteraceae bacterium]
MPGESGDVDAILCAHLLRRVDEKLIELLSSLDWGEWDLQTVAPRGQSTAIENWAKGYFI